jgi:hypothetical protein
VLAPHTIRDETLLARVPQPGTTPTRWRGARPTRDTRLHSIHHSPHRRVVMNMCLLPLVTPPLLNATALDDSANAIQILIDGPRPNLLRSLGIPRVAASRWSAVSNTWVHTIATSPRASRNRAHTRLAPDGLHGGVFPARSVSVVRLIGGVSQVFVCDLCVTRVSPSTSSDYTDLWARRCGRRYTDNRN